MTKKKKNPRNSGRKASDKIKTTFTLRLTAMGLAFIRKQASMGGWLADRVEEAVNKQYEGEQNDGEG
jgi:hypothetical protein